MRRAIPFAVSNVGGFRKYPILQGVHRPFPVLSDEIFLLESNYVTLPWTNDILVVIERFPREQLMWSAAYRAVPPTSAGRRGDYVGVGVLTSDISLNADSLYGFIAGASAFGLQAATDRARNLENCEWSQWQPAWANCVNSSLPLSGIEKIYRLPVEPLCVLLDTPSPQDYIDLIDAATRAERANECRKVFLTANGEIVEAMRIKGQVRILSAKEFVTRSNKSAARSASQDVNRNADVPVRPENGTRNTDTSDFVRFREFQAFRAEIRAEIRKLGERIAEPEPPLYERNAKAMVVTIAVIVIVVALFAWLWFYVLPTNKSIAIYPPAGIQTHNVQSPNSVPNSAEAPAKVD
jgi:hypothetical protein